MAISKSFHNSVRVADTIVACCTATGSAALALIRLSGPEARAIATQTARLASRASLADVPSHSISYGSIIAADGSTLDQVMFLVMDAPRTFTGEHTVEITGHNNLFLVDAIVERLCELGARRARPGEFTQRALENGKMDLLQAEALHDLITAPSRALARTSLAQLDGSLSSIVHEVERELITLAGLCEASFEFSEEEHIDLDFDAMVRQRVADLQQGITQLLAGQSSISQLREGIRIALVGSVNAGKSTLMNALLGRKRAIVSDQAGTTRDSIEASMSDGQYSWTFIDTAGLRETDDVIEQEGIQRSYEAARGADIVLVVIDGSRVLDAATQTVYDRLITDFADRVLVVESKSDVVESTPLACDQLRSRINLLSSSDCRAARNDEHSRNDKSSAPIVSNARHPRQLSQQSLAAADLGSSYCARVSVQPFKVAAAQGIGMDELKNQLQKRIAALYKKAETPFVLNQRHLSLLKSVQEKLQTLPLSDAVMQYELLAAQLHDVLRLVVELTGRNVTEKVMDQVFSTFCIGK